jgi:hypothetical protein
MASNKINVGWMRLPEMGQIECEVVETKDLGPLNVFDAPTPTVVRYLSGKPCKVAWCASQSRWVFSQ